MRLTQAYKIILLILLVSLSFSQILNNFNAKKCPDKLINCIGSACQTTCISSAECLPKKGIVSQKVCYLCGSDEFFSDGNVNKNCQKIVSCIRPNEINVNNRFQCKSGYQYNNFGNCVLIEISCKVNGKIVNGVCVCAKGFYLENKQCKPIPNCPLRSKWNQAKLSCVCDSSSQNIIDNVCQVCQANSIWNGIKCVCRSGFLLIDGVCTQCSPNSDYIRENCICKFSYFGNGINCTACHPSCGTCSNQLISSCLSCAKTSLILSNKGVCSSGLCDQGNFFNDAFSKCEKCPEFCENCASKSNCDKCITGFTQQKISSNGKKSNICIQTCGDGIRFSLQCDDGNRDNGDGCNVNCQVEKGWICVGGSNTSKSICVNNSSGIIIGGSIILGNEIIIGLSMKSLPPQATINNCPQCSSFVVASIISSPVIPISQTGQFIGTTQYRFLYRFIFKEISANFVFNFKINVRQSFRDWVFFQQQVITIDTALLPRFVKNEQLNLNPVITVFTFNPLRPEGFRETIIINGFSSKALRTLFPYQ